MNTEPTRNAEERAEFPTGQRHLHGDDDGRSFSCESAGLAALVIAERGGHLDDRALGLLHDCLAGAAEADQAMLARAYILAVPRERLSDAAAELLHDRRDLVRDAASDALAEIGPAAHAAVRELLRDEDRDVRWFATEGLAHEGREDAIPLLVDQLADDDFSIRWVATNGLLRIGSASIVPILRALVEREPSLLFHNATRRVLSRVSASTVLHESLRELVDSLGRSTTVYESQGLAAELLEKLLGERVTAPSS